MIQTSCHRPWYQTSQASCRRRRPGGIPSGARYQSCQGVPRSALRSARASPRAPRLLRGSSKAGPLFDGFIQAVAQTLGSWYVICVVHSPNLAWLIRHANGEEGHLFTVYSRLSRTCGRAIGMDLCIWGILIALIFYKLRFLPCLRKS